MTSAASPWPLGGPDQSSQSTAAPRWYAGPLGVLALWAAMAGVYLAIVAAMPYKPYDADDLMRLQQVRDLLDGQAWFDVTQYRMNAPDGAAMHWSRLVDVPLAGAMLLLGAIMAPATAEFWAVVLIPLLYMGAALFLVRAIMLRLGFGDVQVLTGLALAALFPLLPAAFAPMRIDHHAPQALAALAAAALFLREDDRRAAMAAGLAAAVWLVISLEGLPVVALLAGLYGLRYAISGDRSLAWFLGALALAAPTLSLATRPLSEFALWCDILLPAHWAAFAAAAALAAILHRLPAQDRVVGRLAALAILPLVCAPLAYALLGPCTAGPFAMIDPLLKTFWYDQINEGLPVWQLPPAYALPTLYTALIVVVGLVTVWRSDKPYAANRTAWALYALLALGVACYGIVLLRETMVAQLLAIPFAAALLAHFLPRARRLESLVPRVVASFACILLVTPAAASLAGKQLSATAVSSGPAVRLKHDVAAMAPCAMPSLAQLPRGRVFATFNSAPTILAHTRHAVTAGGYHRNAEGLRRVIVAFVGSPQQSEALVRASGADYLVACLQDASLMVFAQGRPDSLAQQILFDQAPAWLEPVPAFSAGSLRVWRVR